MLIAVQAFWRGTSVRLTSGRRKADMRLRLRQAALKAAQSPHCQLGFQTKAALQQLAAAKHLPQAFPAMATLSMCSQYSKGCCRIIAGTVTHDLTSVTVGNCIWALQFPSQQWPYPLLHYQSFIVVNGKLDWTTYDSSQACVMAGHACGASLHSTCGDQAWYSTHMQHVLALKKRCHHSMQ